MTEEPRIQLRDSKITHYSNGDFQMQIINGHPCEFEFYYQTVCDLEKMDVDFMRK